MKFFAVSNILFTFGMFEQLLLAVKNRVCLENVHCIEIRFLITCPCSENRVFPEIFHCIEYSFYIQDFLATCACPEKQSVP